MSAVLPPAVISDIFAKADASDGSPRALDRIAGEHGLMLDELRTLLARRHTPLVQRPAGASHGASTGRKACSGCKETKPFADFYPDPKNASGLSSQCAVCNNRRTPTVSRMVRNRARNRAYQLLAKAHAAEFRTIMERELAAAAAEHARLQQAASGRPDAALARLKPGPKRKGETDPTQRLDVARCPTCHTHHDDQHVCPSCGDETPERPDQVKPYMVRAWAIAQGLAPVPTRGPLPERITLAYNEAHEQAAVS